MKKFRILKTVHNLEKVSKNSPQSVKIKVSPEHFLGMKLVIRMGLIGIWTIFGHNCRNFDIFGNSKK